MNWLHRPLDGRLQRDGLCQSHKRRDAEQVGQHHRLLRQELLKAVHRTRGCCQAIQFLVVEVYHERVDYFHIR